MDKWMPIAISAFSVLTAIWTFQKGRKSSVAKDRLFIAVGPAFLMLEPYLYKPITEKAVLSAYISTISFIRKESLLAGCQLYRYSPSGINQNDYMSFCKQLDSEYDKLCRSVGIALRSFSYRANHGQPQGIFRWAMFIIKNLIVFVVVLFALMTYAGFVMLKFEESVNAGQLMSAVIYSIPLILIVICVYIDAVRGK